MDNTHDYFFYSVSYYTSDMVLVAVSSGIYVVDREFTYTYSQVLDVLRQEMQNRVNELLVHVTSFNRL